MGALIVIAIIFTAIVIFDYLALSRGVDTRPVSDIVRTPGGILPV